MTASSLLYYDAVEKLLKGNSLESIEIMDCGELVALTWCHCFIMFRLIIDLTNVHLFITCMILLYLLLSIRAFPWFNLSDWLPLNITCTEGYCKGNGKRDRQILHKLESTNRANRAFITNFSANFLHCHQQRRRKMHDRLGSSGTMTEIL